MADKITAMELLTRYDPALEPGDLPASFPSPFSHTPHPSAWAAALQLQTRLQTDSDLQHHVSGMAAGQMFGVLVVRDPGGGIGFLSAFSGMLAGQWQLPGFVPPLFDLQQRRQLLGSTGQGLSRYDDRLAALNTSGEYRELSEQLQRLTGQQANAFTALKREHKARKVARREQRQHGQGETAEMVQRLVTELAIQSQRDSRELQAFKVAWAERFAALRSRLAAIDKEIAAVEQARSELADWYQQQRVASYTLDNGAGEQRPLSDLFGGAQPPSGAGDCAAPKLLHYAQRHQLEPLALVEFWWGASPREEVRHHGRCYPCCRGKCLPILPFMLSAIALEPVPLRLQGGEPESHEPSILFEDGDLLVVNKPYGLLSVPGKAVSDSVLSWLQRRYPDATGPLLVHRLDMSTSGLLLAAKNRRCHKLLQQQFEQRTIEKRYVAIIDKRLPEGDDQGVVELPLRVDLDDRPRQLVCPHHGRSAITRWRVIERVGERTRVYLSPLTGRTHQLRIHAAHQDGLDAPIVGDELYSAAVGRLRLHAERLRFIHPVTSERIEVISPAPF